MVAPPSPSPSPSPLCPLCLRDEVTRDDESTISLLPFSILEHILSLLPSNDLQAARLTSKALKRAARGVSHFSARDRAKKCTKSLSAAEDVASGRALAERVAMRALGEARVATFVLRCIDANAITKLSLPCAGGCFDTRALKMHNATPKVHLLTVTVVRRLVAALPNLEVASVPVEVGPSRFMSARHEDRLAYDLYALCSGTDRTKRQKRVDVRVDVRVRFASARLAALLCGDALPNSNPPLPPLTARTTTTTSSSSSSTLPHPTDPHNTSSRSPHTVAVFHTNAVRRFTCHLPSPSHLTALGRSVAACPSLDSLKVKPWGARVPGPRLSASAEQLGWSCAMSRMRVLDLTACGLGVKGFVALARGLAAGGAAAYLQAFLVGQREGPARASGRCGDAGAAALAEALLSPSWSMLEFFCVAHNGVTDAGAHAVARAVESRLARGETPALRQVSLKGNMLSKRALNRICAVNRVLSSRSGSADIDFDAVDLGGFLYEKKESAL